ncbi:MAG TPA: YciI family protein [Solirubrobacteraceae bacterium]|nr:YciI family protein [Solirubrobacteraceae bacterium]
MEYMLLIYGDPTAAPAEDRSQAWTDLTVAMRDAGVLRSGEALQPPDSATTLRVRGGERLVADGPFAETKEFLLGFYVIDVPDLDAALDWAARLPSADWGTTEVRPTLGAATSSREMLQESGAE